MNITPGIEVLTRVALPDGFVPVPDYAPMWLQSGKEVAVAGTRNGHAVIIGYGGTGYRDERVIAEDGGVGAPDGSIVDLAPSPNGMVLALAVANGKEKRLDVTTRDIISEGAGHPIANFDGDFDRVSLGWLGEFTIPIALRTTAEPPGSPTPTPQASPTPAGEDASDPEDSSEPDAEASPEPDAQPSTAAPTAASSGLYIINISGVVTTGYLKMTCPMSRLSWSPAGIVAVGSGDAKAPASIIDRENESCSRINAKAPIHVIDWAHDSKSFLYSESNPAIGTGTYRYDLEKKTTRLVAIASSATAFVGNDQVLALGSGALTFRGAQFAPEGPIRAEVAVSNPAGTETQVTSLGFNTTPAMLTASTMTYTRTTDTAAISTFSPSNEGPMRKIVIYSVAPKRAFLIAFGLARGDIAMSWSPRGRYLAIADGDATAAALTILAPPR